jgi:serine/threonine-protein kinase RsbW
LKFIFITIYTLRFVLNIYNTLLKTLNYKIDSSYNEVTELITRIKDDGLYYYVDKKTKGEIEICLVEALNNVVRHSYKEKKGFEILINITIFDSLITFQITEFGLPRPKSEKPSLEFDPDDIENLPEGGMGLYIIDNLMDKTEYNSSDGKNTFTMIKNI